MIQAIGLIICAFVIAENRHDYSPRQEGKRKIRKFEHNHNFASWVDLKVY